MSKYYLRKQTTLNTRQVVPLIAALGLASIALSAGCMTEMDMAGDTDSAALGAAYVDDHDSEVVGSESYEVYEDAPADALELYTEDKELELAGSSHLAPLASCGTTNLARWASTSASSTYCSGTGLHCYHPYRINDGSRDTTVGGYYSWTNSSTSLPQWVKVDFGSKQTFNRFELYTSSGYALRDYRIEYWTGWSWSTVVSVYGNTQTRRTHRFSPRSGYQVRVVGLKGPSNQPQYVRVNELEVYNDCNMARSASTSASSTYCSGTGLHCYHPYRINDGSRDTTVGGYYSWTNGSTSLPQWVSLDFGSNKSFGRVELYTSSGYPISDYKIQYLSGSTWYTAVSVYGNTSLHRRHTFSTRTGSRVRVLGSKGPTNQPQYVRVNELEVY